MCFVQTWCFVAMGTKVTCCGEILIGCDIVVPLMSLGRVKVLFATPAIHVPHYQPYHTWQIDVEHYMQDKGT